MEYSCRKTVLFCFNQGKNMENKLERELSEHQKLKNALFPTKKDKIKWTEASYTTSEDNKLPKN